MQQSWSTKDGRLDILDDNNHNIRSAQPAAQSSIPSSTFPPRSTQDQSGEYNGVRVNSPGAMDEQDSGTDTTPTTASSGHPGNVDLQDTGSSLAAESSTSTQLDEQSTSSAQNASTEPSASSQAGSGSLKRGMACSFCRRRKLRCSGERPKCTSCVKYHKDCEYGTTSKTGKYRALESRIAELSDFIRQGGDSPQLPPSHTVPPPILDPSSSNSSSISYTLPPTTNYDANLQNFPTTETYDPNLYANPESFLDFSSHQFSSPDQGGLNPNAFSMTIPEVYQPFGNPPQINYMSGWEQTPLSVFPPYEPPPDQQSQLNHSISPVRPIGLFGFSDSPLQNNVPQMSQNNVPQIAVPPPNFQAPQPQPPQAQLGSFHSTPSLNTTPATDRKPILPIKMLSSQQSSVPTTHRSNSSTPDDMMSPPLATTVDPETSKAYGRPLPTPGHMNGPLLGSQYDHIAHVSHIDPIDGITESLGEFLFSPTESKKPLQDTPEFAPRKRRGIESSTSSTVGGVGGGRSRPQSLIKVESDGLTDSVRDLLLDCFLAHSRLFFEMSIPRFRYRMTFTDRRRPALALLYAMYLWATRMSNSPNMSSMEHHFFKAACQALDVSSANGDRLIDCLRAAMLLSVYSFTSGRFHEGWILAGMAVRLVLSTGLHQIKSCVFTPEPPRNPLLRGKVYLLPPPEDATELAERISTFWCVCAIDRCSSLATGFPVGLRDEDISTPFPRSLPDIAARIVTQHDDVSVRDLYRQAYFTSEEDTPFSKWMKAVLIIERASKLAFIDPDQTSEYACAWSTYYNTVQSNPSTPVPPAWLDQPKYRCPKDYSETKLGLDQLVAHMGADGIFPVDRRKNAEIHGTKEPYVTPHTIMLHHQFAAIHMLLHDINAIEVENKDALTSARRSVALIRSKPPVPHTDIDSFIITVWSIITKVLVKEMRRLRLAGDMQGAALVEEDIQLYISEMQRVGTIMQLARSQAKALKELLILSMAMPTQQPSPDAVNYNNEYPHL